ncbi:MAG: polynucleotide adenylyltransferase PcnB [Acidobacteriota bacterium]|nr:polynucleotide adenylyltransferase PcnB [Acidobacteriota bacterium]
MSERNGEWGVGGGEWDSGSQAEPAISDSPAISPPVRESGVRSLEPEPPLSDESPSPTPTSIQTPTPHSRLPTPDEDAVVIDRSDHPISRRRIPENVLKVLYRLHRSGYRAYLCGGSVRDLLMSGTPKDFDIATDAHPTEIRRLFRNSRIIGRRFRLVHIIFQDMLVEVATFRREPDRADDVAELLITDDNTFGSPLQDARRRDFTINALFYNIADFSVIDYVGGLEDLEAGRVRVIGDPDVRFREDPVRMMRAIEFASRLGFEIEPATYDAILRHKAEILKASAPRVSEEILDLLRRGWSRGAIRLMVDSGLLDPLVPEVYKSIAGERASYFWKMLEVLDRTVQAGRKISDPVLLSVLFLPWILQELESEEARRDTRMKLGEVILFIRELIQPMCTRMALAAGTRHQIETALETLWRLLEPPADRRAQLRFVFREPFNDALALLELYALSSGKYVEVFRQWQQFAQRAHRAADDEAPAVATKRRRRRR